MSIFNELLPKLFEISKTSTKNFNDELQAALSCLDLFEEEYQNGRGTARERAQRDKTLMTTLQSINEDDDESNKTPEQRESAISTDKPAAANGKRRVSKKRSKDEVDGMSSPEQDKRTKRNASVKAQSIITKQDKTRQILKDLNENGVAFVSTEKVNVNLNQKMRREGSNEKKSRRRNEDDKENSQPSVPPIQIKQEKISLPPEPMDTDALMPVDVKQEPKDASAMPPPAAPVPKPRKGLQKEKQKEKESVEPEESGGRRRTTRTRKQTDTAPPATVASARSTRASSRASSRATKPADSDKCEEEMPPPPPPPPEPRPKRTRAKKKTSESSNTDNEKNITRTDESAPTSPAEKPRPKRTRRGKNAEKEAQKTEEPPQKDQENTTKEQPKTANDQTKATRDQTLTKDEKGSQESIQLKEERISLPGSPLLQKPKRNKKIKGDKYKANKTQKTSDESSQISQDSQFQTPPQSHITIEDTITTKTNLNVTVTLNGDMDKTVVLHNGVYNHAPHTPKANNIHAGAAANATVVLEKDSRATMLLDHQHVNDATVVLDKEPKASNITDDNSLLTSDGSEAEVPTTPPKGKGVATTQPNSAVKEKVQQFEELAARTTRTKTRAMAKMEEPDNHTPPDKMIKPVLSQETLNKMNSMIFNGKPPQVTTSASASKPRPPPPKPAPLPASASASKLSALHRHREDKEREDARRKKEALLEAKREMHKKKREEKMANAAAAREAAERERRLAMEAAAKERTQKQMHADQGKLERLKEVERKKQELARKVAETEERRRAEEQARQQRLAEEQKKAELARKKQLEEAEAMKKEAALMAKEIEKRQKEYMEKQKMKLISEKTHTPLKHIGTPGYYQQEPVYMADGFQYLNSDEDEEPVQGPVPAWSTSKARKLTLMYQSQISPHHIDTLFSVRAHTPDLREIFPLIERARLKRTSSAVWRTPPPPPPANAPRAQ